MTTQGVWSAGCAPGVSVELWTLAGSGHGPAVADDATSRIFAFLLGHHR